jgi:hypothetical protein
MRNMLIALLIFTFIPMAGCFPQSQNKGVSQSNRDESGFWDFGNVKHGDIVQHDLVFKNETNKVLNIKAVNASCGCTVPNIKKKTLAPGESTAIEVKFNSKGYSGEIKQFVYVNTDNIDNPIVRFIIKATVVK